MNENKKIEKPIKTKNIQKKVITLFDSPFKIKNETIDTDEDTKMILNFLSKYSDVIFN
jgi:hypothetical protein